MHILSPLLGDLYPWDARAAWGEKVIIGGICPPDFVLRSTEDNLRCVCEIIKKRRICAGLS